MPKARNKAIITVRFSEIAVRFRIIAVWLRVIAVRLCFKVCNKFINICVYDVTFLGFMKRNPNISLKIHLGTIKSPYPEDMLSDMEQICISVVCTRSGT